MLTLADFSYSYPSDLVAQRPVLNRDNARLLVRWESGHLQDSFFHQLTQFLPANSLLVYNQSRVFPARLLGILDNHKEVEIFLLEFPEKNGDWIPIVGKPMRKIKKSRKIFFSDILSGRLEVNCAGAIKLQFEQPIKDVRQNILHVLGHVPLPPYIKRSDLTYALLEEDLERYQTIYAQNIGSVAAPTAGLHFSQGSLDRLKAKKIKMAPIILHVGMGTFLPVKTSQISSHHMHEEKYLIPQKTFDLIIQAKKENRMIISVGTTTLRCLQSFYELDYYRSYKQYVDTWLSTRLFLYPKTKNDLFFPWLIDGLITNFHQPRSTLIMLISALIGYENMRQLYRYAVGERYRLFSYGDSSLLFFNDKLNN